MNMDNLEQTHARSMTMRTLSATCIRFPDTGILLRPLVQSVPLATSTLESGRHAGTTQKNTTAIQDTKSSRNKCG